MESDAGSYFYPSEPGWHNAAALIIVLLLILAATGGGGWMGHGYASRRHQDRRAAARRAIYKSVRRAINQALKARDAGLATAAQDLVRVTTQRLGPLAETGKPILAAIDSVNKALAGRIIDPPKPPPPPPATPETASATKEESGGTMVFTPQVNITLGAREPERKPEPPPAPPKPIERDMTVPEQRAELTKAIEAFDRAWQEDKVEAFLSAMQDALLNDDLGEGGHDAYH